jgi:hypothetical protein
MRNAASSEPHTRKALEKEAAGWRQQKRECARELRRVPRDALPGSLSLTHSRCGNPNCHCAQGKGHPVWQLTFMVAGKKRVERIPAEWADEVKQRVEAGRVFKEALAELWNANAELLVLERKQRRLKGR